MSTVKALAAKRTNNATRQRALEHGWRYFELHANQRMALFNFFLVLSGLVAAGLAASLQEGSYFITLGIVFGLFLIVISFVFWKLDQRVSFLLKHSEAAIATLELENLPVSGQLFANEPSRLSAINSSLHGLLRVWTYGECFRLVFFTMALFGAVIVVLAALRFLSILIW